MRRSNKAEWLISAGLLAISAAASGQWYPAGRPAKLGPMLDQGLVRYQTPELTLRLVRSSGTVAGLEAKDPAAKGGGFDFTPSELLAARSTGGYYHLGDLDLRLREQGKAEWRGYSTAAERHAVKPLPPGQGELQKDDLRPTLPADFPLQVTRSWAVVEGKLALRFTLKNPGTKAIEIGALGIPLVFDNIISGKELDEAHRACSFSDPSIALDGGYVQVTRLNGHGPELLVVPDGKTPFEAYNPIAGPERREPKTLFEDRTPRNMTFEGFYEWMVASAAYQQNEWKQAEEWNPATSIILQPGEERTVGLRFLVADSIRSIEKDAGGKPPPCRRRHPRLYPPPGHSGQPLPQLFANRSKTSPLSRRALSTLPPPQAPNTAGSATKYAANSGAARGSPSPTPTAWWRRCNTASSSRSPMRWTIWAASSSPSSGLT